MKKLILSLTLWFALVIPASADIYFPIVYRTLHPCQEVAAVSDFKVIVPTATTNKVLNPSFETTGNFAAEAGTTVTRVTTFQHYGLYSARVETNANNEGIEITLSALANAIHYVTVRVRGTLPTTWDWSLNDSTFTSPTLLETIDGDWKLYGLQFSATQANGSTKLSIHQNGSGSGDFYLDGIQVEENTTWTTFCDGSQPGCEWNGSPNASTSSRSESSRAGGIVYDLEDDYGFKITGMSGTGTAPQELFIDSYSQLPGGELNAIKINSRVITLSGLISEATTAEFYATKQALEALFAPDTYPEDENGPQPVRLRFTGATVHKEIAVHYETGLETNITADDPCAWERVAVRFIADDPYWYEIGESAALLDTNDTATFRTVAARLRSTSQWNPLGPPNASGTYTDVLAIAEDATYVYFGGTFSNFNNIAAADNIVRYNKQTGVWSAIDNGLNNAVADMAFSPSGDLYIVGLFTNASGVAAADLVAKLAAGGTAFEAVGVPSGAISIDCVAYGGGKMYFGGAFTALGGAANADNIAAWDIAGAAYEAVGSGRDGGVLALAYQNGFVYAGGVFTGELAKYDAAKDTWLVLGNGLDAAVETIAVTPDGTVYVGGHFTEELVTLTELNYAAVWNGTALAPLGSGLDDIVYKMALGPDGELYLSGNFLTAGDIELLAGLARWNGYTFSHPDIAITGDVFSVITSKYADPVVPQNYSIYLGFGASGTGAFAGKVTAANGGTAPAFPKIVFNRSGGTGATIQTLRNERTGKEILLNWSLQNGETLTIDLGSTEKNVTSSTGLPAQSAILPNSDLGDWSLLTGNNSITSFVSEAGSPTIVGYMLWKDKYRSQN